ncbi:MAG TPA: TatD family hydrolase [Cyclobacteriaceae bacterium]
MNNFWIDTHAHVYSEEFKSDRDDLLARTAVANIGKVYMPNVDHTSIEGMFEIEESDPDRYISMMGLHPCSVKADFEKELAIVESWLSKRTFAAVGEMGTDLFWDKTFWEQQKEAFKIQVGWAKKYQLPIVIHCRESMNETIELLEPLLDGKLTGVFHCFTGSLEQAQRIISMGFYLGLGGVTTFKNGGLDKVIPRLGLEQVVLETDSPYLAPVPNRGKRNEPSYIPIIAQRVADLKQMPLNQIQAITTTNALRLFKSHQD